MGTSTRNVAAQLWGPDLPDRDPARLVRELYPAENAGKPSRAARRTWPGSSTPASTGSTTTVEVEGGYFPCHVESCNDPQGGAVARAGDLDGARSSNVCRVQPAGYSKPRREVGAAARAVGQGLLRGYRGAVMPRAGRVDERIDALLGNPAPTRRPASDHRRRPDGTARLLSGRATRARCTRAAAGGYLYVVSEEPVPGGFQVRVRAATGGRRKSGGQVERKSSFRALLTTYARATSAFSEAAGRRGRLSVALWPDELVQQAQRQLQVPVRGTALRA